MNIYTVPEQWRLELYLNPTPAFDGMDDEELWETIMLELFQTVDHNGEKNPRYGATNTPEHNDAISRANSVPKPHISKLMKQRHKDGLAYQWTSEDNPRSRKVVCDGVEYNTISEATHALGYKNHNTIRYRINSDSPKWSDYYYA